MRKITIMGIVSGVVLAVGLFSNIGLFGNDALADKPTIEQKITTIFWFITNPEFGLKEIKNEVRNIEGDVTDINTKLDGKPDIKHVSNTVSLANVDNFFIFVSCDENFQVKSVYADADDPDNDIDIIYNRVQAIGDFEGTGSETWDFLEVPFDPVGVFNLSGHELLSQMQVGRPIGVPADGILEIHGQNASSDHTDDVLGAAAVVDTAQTATCDLTITTST